ncbi:heterokaryon incompatibility protein-domain-containing protein [Daldinia grandis]|nr:heterokaryon incompatibility protein-domain-containing protein [Daldinia grandis]
MEISEMPAETSGQSQLEFQLKQYAALTIPLSDAENLISDLCKRDDRFRFLGESIKMFKVDYAGLVCTLLGRMVSDMLSDGTARSNASQEISDYLEDIDRRHYSSSKDLYEIIRSAIYEILNVFRIHVTKEQVLSDTNVAGQLNLLRYLSEISKNAEQRPYAPRSHEITKKPEEDTYQYSHCSLRTGKGTMLSNRIRILIILPGFEGSPIDCSLEIRDLSKEVIDEALSYVWGQSEGSKYITVDKRPFRVSDHLFDILGCLRDPHAKRAIWIDAICINQSDSEEKVHQVRLMRNIYSKAKRTTIWLSGRTLKEQPVQPPQLGIPNNRENIFYHLPPNFMGITIDQYDLRGILEKFHELRSAVKSPDEIDREGWGLITMLIRCVNVIMSQKWWERVWTIQEAALPLEHPHILFQGHGFSFEDLIAARTAIDELQVFMATMDPGSAVEIDYRLRGYLSVAFQQQISYWLGHREAPILQHLRPGTGDQWSDPMYRSLHSLLCETNTYRATDPRDKVFALESLLPNSLGRLIYVDYNEPIEDVFRRVTARCYNSHRMIQSLSTHFDPLIETKPSSTGLPSGPSWVHDFTYSNVELHQDKFVQEVTLNGYLYNQKNWQPMCKGVDDEIETPTAPDCFATPTTLFCSGVKVDVIHRKGIIPDLSGPNSHVAVIQFTEDLIKEHPSYDQRAIEHIRYLKELALTSDLDPLEAHEKASPQTQGQAKDAATEEPARKHPENTLFLQLLDLFTLNLGSDPDKRWTVDVGQSLREHTDKEFELRELAGKEFFITDGGLIGIATVANIRKGDILGIFHMSPVYYVLREAEHQGDGARDVRQHRIVSRAVVSDKRDQMEKRIGKLSSCDFQIV